MPSIPPSERRKILEIATGLRPTLNHHNPEIRYSRARRLIEINGLFRHGFMISPRRNPPLPSDWQWHCLTEKTRPNVMKKAVWRISKDKIKTV